MPLSSHIYYSQHISEIPNLPPVILIHGAGENHLSWPPEIRRLLNWNVLALDLPGHGRSEGVGQQTIEGYTGQVLQFLESIGVFQAVLVGHSMGAAVAIQAALTEPKRVVGLGLVSGGACMQAPLGLLENLSHPVTNSIGLDILKKQLFAPNTPKELIQQTMKSFEAARAGVLYGDWLACARYDLSGRLDQIQAPCWAAVGEADKITPPGFSYHIQSQIKETAVQVIPNSGHMVMLEAPSGLARGLEDFLRLKIQLAV